MAGLSKAWGAGALPPADLDIDRLWTTARETTGLADDMDGVFFEDQLGRLLSAIERQAQLTDFGRLIAHGSILKVMQERLRFADLWRWHPEIGDIRLAPPIIIVAPMRSGSTRLQRMLAADPAHDAVQLHQSMAPVPGRGGQKVKRIWQTRAALWLLRSINPNVHAIHPTGPREVDEEVGLLEQSLFGALLEAQRYVPDFARHGEQVDATPAYQRMRELLQLRVWQTGGEPGRPLVLKSPQYQQDLPVVAQIFPGAKYLFLRRDLPTVVASSASLAYHQMAIQSDHVDPHIVGREWLYKTAWRQAVTACARHFIPAGDQLDIDYAEMEADPEAVMHRIYAFLGRPWGEAAQRAAARYQARAKRRHPFARHRYRLEDFGLDRQMIEDFVASFELPGNMEASAEGQGQAF